MTNKKNIILGSFIMTALILGYAGLANAATYQFINTSGQLSSVVANSPQEALATAHNLALHSGVILVNSNTSTNTNTNTSSPVVTGDGLYLYQFINTSGQLSSVVANSPQEALATAHNLALHSGVILR